MDVEPSLRPSQVPDGVAALGTPLGDLVVKLEIGRVRIDTYAEETTRLQLSLRIKYELLRASFIAVLEYLDAYHNRIRRSCR